MTATSDNKAFYETHHDRIAEKRFESKYPIRRAVHRDIYDSVLQWITPGQRVLDAGCGEGVLSCLMAERGAVVTAVDYSRPNIDAAIARAAQLGHQIDFRVADAEHLPFADHSFDVVVSNHVLEHLPDFEQGIREIHRVTAGEAIVAVPTCLNPCSWALLGGDRYWRVGKRSAYAIPFGLARVVKAWVGGDIGVDETYAGNADNTHIFRFPRIVQQALTAAGFDILTFEAQSIRLPYVGVDLSSLRTHSVFRHCGLGTVYRLRAR